MKLDILFDELWDLVVDRGIFANVPRILLSADTKDCHDVLAALGVSNSDGLALRKATATTVSTMTAAQRVLRKASATPKGE